jgi:hypothetical protein
VAGNIEIRKLDEQARQDLEQREASAWKAWEEHRAEKEHRRHEREEEQKQRQRDEDRDHVDH